MIRHIIGLGIALTFTFIIFLGASFFGAVWTHYFAGEPANRSTGEVSVKILPNPATGNGMCDPHTGKCSSAPDGSAPKPHG